jgi:hypothetical protein
MIFVQGTMNMNPAIIPEFTADVAAMVANIIRYWLKMPPPASSM